MHSFVVSSRALRLLGLTLLVACLATPALAVAETAAPAPSAAPAVAPDPAPAPGAEAIPEAAVCSAAGEKAVDSELSVLAPTVFDHLKSSWGSSCPRPGDCRYGGYCYLDCSDCETNADCPFNTCTPIPLC